ncbi:hypothetical protein GUJ93_ZPchr0004g38859 [Zizania palustris]|uniref:Uncharacterized protein n=1 Tax=Zizania palustris TaxID=103762 RepID=A0A8J5S091_ZIZPA|nr:hypothetical protein GUJ93_ZPchr0004g38859 [Zizania palustris]
MLEITSELRKEWASLESLRPYRRSRFSVPRGDRGEITLEISQEVLAYIKEEEKEKASSSSEHMNWSDSEYQTEDPAEANSERLLTWVELQEERKKLRASKKKRSVRTKRTKMPVRTMNGNLRDEAGFIRELRMLVSFLGFEHEPMYHGVFPDEEESFCEVTVVVQPSPQTAHTYRGGGPTFLVASQRTALQALRELRMIYDSELYDTDFRFVPLRTPGSPHSVFVSTLSQRHSAIGHTMRLLEAMDDLHYEALQDANGQRNTISFYRQSSEDLNHENRDLRRLIQQGHRLAAEAEELRRQNELLRQRVATNPQLRYQIEELKKDIEEIAPILPRRKKPLRIPTVRPKRISRSAPPAGPSSSSTPTVSHEPEIEPSPELP